MLLERDKNATDLANLLGCSKSNISRKFKRDNFDEKDLAEIANVLGCDLKIVFVDRETGREIF